MQVNVFISEVKQDGTAPTILVLPATAHAGIPRHLQDIEWRYFATTEADDKLLNTAPGEVEDAIARDGYLVTTRR